MEKVGPRTLWCGPEDHWGLGRVHRTTPYEQATHLADNERDSERPSASFRSSRLDHSSVCLSVCISCKADRPGVYSVGVVSE